MALRACILPLSQQRVIRCTIAPRIAERCPFSHLREVMTVTPNVAVNSLLSGLPVSSMKNVQRSSELVQLRFSQVIAQPNERMRCVYFPLEWFVSIVAVLEDEDHLRVEIVGNEGMIGAPLALGVNNSPHRAIVQREGVALRMSADAFVRQSTATSMFQ